MPKRSLKPENKDEFIQTVLERYDQDLQDRMEWSDARLQRYAKLRGWLETKNYPWPNASNQHEPSLMINSQRTQDTLHNAILGSRPVISAIALNKADQKKGESIDQLLDYQYFVEQTGEEKTGDLIQSFVDDGKFIAFVPWVREKREVIETSPLPMEQLPPGSLATPMYVSFLQKEFPGAAYEPMSDGLTWNIRWLDQYQQKQKAQAEFYQDEEGRTFVQVTKDKVIFDGPCVIPKELEDVVVPSRAANLQPPGPSNPNGADHVIMVDYPSWDEINRLRRDGYYDSITDDEFEQLRERAEGKQGEQSNRTAADPEEHKLQKDMLAGQQYGNAETISKTFTRLTYFGRFDLDDDGLEEEIVARILIESKTLCRLRHLQEEFPTPTPRRPFAEATFLPVQGQFYGIGLIELLEHMHDLMKVLLDQMIDKHTLSNSPWGMYRSASGIRPEVIRMTPGELYPVSNPQNDVFFPQLPQQDQAMALNLLAMIGQWTEKQSMQGQLQFGAVPQGKASALRTSTNMMSVLQQGDARPERILRRFFRGFADIYRQMHELNQAFLPPDKQYRVTGVPNPAADPYRQIDDPSKIKGDFQFDFKANSLNTTKAIQSQVLSQLLPILANGLTIQLGLTDPEHLYNLLRDLIQSQGQDDSKYLKMPATANVPKITAQDAMGQMVQGILPQGLPAEGAQVHFQALIQFQKDPRYRELLSVDPAFQLIYHTYLQQVQALVMQEQQMAMAAQQFADAMGGGGGPMGQNQQPGPPGMVQPGADQMQPQGPNQVMDESMPGAKGQVM